jgi:hypothetical protein
MAINSALQQKNTDYRERLQTIVQTLPAQFKCTIGHP